MIDKYLNDRKMLLEDEQTLLNRIKKPVVTFEKIQVLLDNNSKSLGYDSLEDMKEKTGWNNRFDNWTDH
jgi:DNA integrity scanning protein DisA with diadenylate cyclase activity